MYKITLPSAEPKSIGIQKQVFLFFEKKNCQHSFTPPRKSCYGKLVPVKEAESILFSKLRLFCSLLVISSCKWKNLSSSLPFKRKRCRYLKKISLAQTLLICISMSNPQPCQVKQPSSFANGNF